MRLSWSSPGCRNAFKLHLKDHRQRLLDQWAGELVGGARPSHSFWSPFARSLHPLLRHPHDHVDVAQAITEGLLLQQLQCPQRRARVTGASRSAPWFFNGNMHRNSHEIPRILRLLEVLQVLEVVDEFVLIKIIAVRELVEIHRIRKTLYELLYSR